MTPNLAASLYLISGVLFILALRGLSSPETSRKGNYFGILGMLLAITVTFLSFDIFFSGFVFIISTLAIGGFIGAIIAYRISMTAMPQLVAGFHSLVGLAAVLVALSAFYNPEAFGLGTTNSINTTSLIEMSIGASIGAITFTGDRMPTLLTLMGYVLLFVFFGRIRFITLSSLILFFAILFPIMNNDEVLKQRYVRFFNEVGFADVLKKNKNETVKKIEENIENTNEETNETSKNKNRIESFFESNHGILYLSAIETWKTKPIFGVGYKSYRTECAKIKTNKKHVCSTHPHNYYLELLTETGLIGTILILSIILLLLKYIVNYINENIFNREKKIYILAPIIITFLLEIWPLKSTGAIFTTWNGTLFWIVLSFALTLRYKKNIY